MTEASPAVAVSARGPDLEAQVERFLGPVLKLMGHPARLAFTTLADGALGVAMHFEEPLPGLDDAKKGGLLDSLQFLVNKSVHRPNVPRRWVNLGVNRFPEPRGGRPLAAAPASSPAAPAEPAMAADGDARVQGAARKHGGKGAPPPPPGPAARATTAARPGGAPPKAEPAPRGGGHDEDGEASSEWVALGKQLGERAVKLGRVYAVMSLPASKRASLMKGAQQVTGLSVKVEGEAHWKRVKLTPPTVTPLPKKHAMPDWDDEG